MKCPACDGRGYTVESIDLGLEPGAYALDHGESVRVTCDSCRGEGEAA